jgi:hypothetical protein
VRHLALAILAALALQRAAVAAQLKMTRTKVTVSHHGSVRSGFYHETSGGLLRVRAGGKTAARVGVKITQSTRTVSVRSRPLKPIASRRGTEPQITLWDTRAGRMTHFDGRNLEVESSNRREATRYVRDADGTERAIYHVDAPPVADADPMFVVSNLESGKRFVLLTQTESNGGMRASRRTPMARFYALDEQGNVGRAVPKRDVVRRVFSGERPGLGFYNMNFMYWVEPMIGRRGGTGFPVVTRE